jgi:isocitrate dehydrogenase
MIRFDKLKIPDEGEKIQIINDTLVVPEGKVIIPYIEGDGIGRDIMTTTKKVLDSAVKKAYNGKKEIIWFEIYAGGKAKEKYGEVLPNDTYKAIEYYIVAIKGPLTTPIGGGYRSLNVTLRQKLDLYSCIRPVKYYKGVPSPVKNPEKMDIIIFRENTEDVYAGIEWQKDSKESKKILRYLNEESDIKLPEESRLE